MGTKLKISDNAELKLIRKAKSGCAESIAQLVRNYHMDVRSFMIRRIGNFSVAEDLSQDALVTAISKLESLKDNTSFRAWLFTIARNKAIDHIRKLGRERELHRNIEYLIANENTVTSLAASSTPESAFDSEPIRKALMHCINQLGDKGRGLVHSYYFDRQSAESIATQQNQKSSSVRMALLRIRKALAKCIRRNPEVDL